MLDMNRVILMLSFFCFVLVLSARGREVVVLDEGWKFCNRDVAGAEKPVFDDGGWQQVKVPHDWAIGGVFDMNIDAQLVQVIEDGDTMPRLRTGRTGALPMFGVGWYRKVLPLDAGDVHKRIFIEFDGAMSEAKVYLNGVFVGQWPYGYSSFSFELTGLAEPRPTILLRRSWWRSATAWAYFFRLKLLMSGNTAKIKTVTICILKNGPKKTCRI